MKTREPWVGMVLTVGLAAAWGRGLEVRDLFRMEALGEAMVAADGELVAFVRVRGKSTAGSYVRNFMDGRDRSDVWVYEVRRGRAWAVSDGGRDGAGFFAPAWSPDGRTLAFLSTRGGGVSLWTWRRGSRRVRRVSAEAVELERPVWVSNREVVCASPAEGEQPLWWVLDVNATLKAGTEWARAQAGRTATASELRSPGDGSMAGRAVGRLLRFDVEKRSRTVLGRGLFAGISASPDGRQVAAFEVAGRVVPRKGARLESRNPARYQLVVFEGGEGRVKVEAGDGEEALPGGVAWLRDGTVAVRVGGVGARADWHAVGRDGVRRNLTAEMESVPAALVGCGTWFAYVSGGRLWRLGMDGRRAQALTEPERMRVDGVVSGEKGALVVRGSVGGVNGLFEVDGESGAAASLPPMDEGAEPAAYSARTKTLVMRGAGWLRVRKAGESSSRVMVEVNGFAGEIEQGEFRPFRYAGRGGRELTGWMLLPPGYDAGRRYPAVVTAYPGLAYTAALKPRETVRTVSAYNMHLLAARGYVVVYASVPLDQQGRRGEPYEEIGKAVDAAAEAAVATGVVDGGRMAFLGHSFGGYAALVVATRSERFRAVVACAGFGNLASLYGAIDARFRYDERARERLLFMTMAESGQFLMGAAPWEDAARYARNSPMTYVERVRTPVMIVQGDQDYVPVQQGEEFFSALYRQEKEAVFLRYWGEGHVLESPANIEDFWLRMPAWLGRQLEAGPGAR